MPKRPPTPREPDAGEAPPVAALPTKEELDGCRCCDLWERATQGVPGRGSERARLMLVGEQPGDEEDRAGEAFIGPAGKLLERALDEAGLSLSQVWLTNAVKHFAWEPRGKRRIHKTPAQREITACRAWLEREIARVKPAVIVALGVSALNGVMGRRLKVGEAREATLHHAGGARVIATYHPSAVLRAPDPDGREALMQALVADLAAARKLAR